MFKQLVILIKTFMNKLIKKKEICKRISKLSTINDYGIYNEEYIFNFYLYTKYPDNKQNILLNIGG
jgi:hypothetical protein